MFVLICCFGNLSTCCAVLYPFLELPPLVRFYEFFERSIRLLAFICFLGNLHTLVRFICLFGNLHPIYDYICFFGNLQSFVSFYITFLKAPHNSTILYAFSETFIPLYTYICLLRISTRCTLFYAVLGKISNISKHLHHYLMKHQNICFCNKISH